MFLGKDGFTWFVGVVEDRLDPVQLGRVRVRCFGFHTEDKTEIPTSALPWAVPMNNINSGSVSGLGNSPTGMVEGTWAIGFFLDGERAQEPVIMGTLPGIPEQFADGYVGFNDPNGVYPKYVNDSDVNWAARENRCANHNARLTKNNNRLMIGEDGAEIVAEYPTAVPPKISTVAPDRSDSYYTLKTWSEIAAANNSVVTYPNNHVYETESGHLQEFDDTSGAERYHRYHPSGSYEEIIADGTKTVKVIGDNYELIMENDNIYIKGNLNVTVDGTKRELIKGDYHLQVEGEVSYDFQKSWQKKVRYNDEQEIGKTRSCNIGQNDYLTLVRGESVENVLNNRKYTYVNGTTDFVSQDVFGITTYTDLTHFAKRDYKHTNLGEQVITSKGNVLFETGANLTETVTSNHSVTVGGTWTDNVTNAVTITGSTIDLN